MEVPLGKKVYFASDFHLGIPDHAKSLERERKIIRWLDEVKKDAFEIYLVGDLFDYWFEYKQVVPKGYVRFLGKLAEIVDAGIPVHVFTGNHDMWMFDYLPKEVGVELHRNPIEKTFNASKFMIGHGDGLGPGDHGYKILKKIFANSFFQWIFARFHPNFGIWIMKVSSKGSRAASGKSDEIYQGDEKEFLVQYCLGVMKTKHFDHFIFGHRHLPIEKQLTANSKYTNLGEWLNYETYAVFDGSVLELKSKK
jgi:UDP-2,3-diacylglucosamine hydrolase